MRELLENNRTRWEASTPSSCRLRGTAVRGRLFILFFSILGLDPEPEIEGGHDPGTGVAGGPDLPPGSDESHPDLGPETDTGATAAVPGATAGATAGLPGTGVRNTSSPESGRRGRSPGSTGAVSEGPLTGGWRAPTGRQLRGGRRRRRLARSEPTSGPVNSLTNIGHSLKLPFIFAGYNSSFVVTVSIVRS